MKQTFLFDLTIFIVRGKKKETLTKKEKTRIITTPFRRFDQIAVVGRADALTQSMVQAHACEPAPAPNLPRGE